jgi:hypothetical protein
MSNSASIAECSTQIRFVLVNDRAPRIDTTCALCSVKSKNGLHARSADRADLLRRAMLRRVRKDACTCLQKRYEESVMKLRKQFAVLAGMIVFVGTVWGGRGLMLRSSGRNTTI